MTPAAFFISIAVVFFLAALLSLIADEQDRRARHRHRARVRRHLRRLEEYEA